MVRWPLGLCLWKAISSGWELFSGFFQYVVGKVAGIIFGMTCNSVPDFISSIIYLC